MKILTATTLLVLSIAHSALAGEHIGEKAHSAIINNQGKEIGEAHYTQGNEGVLLEIKLDGLPAVNRH